ARGMSRRRFMQTAAGASAVGAALGTGIIAPRLVSAAGPGIGEALPIAGGSSAIEAGFGKLFHVYGPPGADSPDSDPSTVGNFNGDVGLAYINGMVTETNRRTGDSRELPFI